MNMGKAAATGGQSDPFAVDEDAALAELESWRCSTPATTLLRRWRRLVRGHQRRRGAVRRHPGRARTGLSGGALAGLAVTGQDRPALPVDGREDSVTRRQRFEQVHPEAVILPPSAGRWRAVVLPGLIPGDGPRTTLGAWDLGGLMDQLEEIWPPDGSAGSR